MNFYTLAAREEKMLSKMKSEYRKIHQHGIDDIIDKKDIEKMEEQLDEIFERTYRRAVKRMLAARAINEELELTEPKGNRMYYVTIRPKCNSITFDDFYILVQKLMNRKCFDGYMLTFEQKGTSDDTLGHGFHVHFVAKMKQRGKDEVIRDVYSTVKHCTEKHCIQVDITYNGTQLFNNYCIEYESKDNHKASTKEWDAKWRKNVSIADYYENEIPDRGPAIKSNAGPIVIEMN